MGKFNLAEALAGRVEQPFRPIVRCLFSTVDIFLEVWEARAIMSLLVPSIRIEITGNSQTITPEIDLNLFKYLNMWVNVHLREHQVAEEDKEKLRKMDMKNLVAYTKIYLQGTDVVEDQASRDVLEHIRALVNRATIQELDGFVQLINSEDLKRDEKLNQLKRALVMR